MKGVSEELTGSSPELKVSSEGERLQETEAARTHDQLYPLCSATFPIERLRAARNPFVEQSVKLRLARNVTKSIAKWSFAYGVEPASYLLSVWQILIWHLLNRSECVITVTLPGTTRRLPAITRNSQADSSVQDFVKAVHEQVDGYLMRLEQPSQAVGNDVENAGSALLFEIEESHSNGGPPVPFLLRCRCKCAGEATDITIDYDSSRIDHQDAELLAEQYSQLCGDALAAMHTPITNLTVTGELTGQVLQVAQTKIASLPEMFTAQASRNAQRPAVVAGDGTMTYGELLRESRVIADFLRKRNVNQDVVVAVVAERSVHTVAALLGVMLAGGAYAPLDPETPPAYWAKQIAASGIDLVLTVSSAEICVISESVRAISITQILAEHSNADLPEDHGVDPRSLAYVIHTSGSTGVPKAVGITHHGLANYAEGICSRLGMSKRDAPLSFALACSLAVDLGHTCLFPAMITGGCLHLLGKTMAMDPAAFAEYMSKNLIDVLKIVPSHLRALLTIGGDVLPKQWVIVGGEPFSSDLYQRIQDCRGSRSCRVINHYGPTETTVGCLMNLVRADDEILLPPILSAGDALPGDTCYVLDEAMRPVGINMPGELFAGGTGVARGYLHQPAETAERFVPDPFSSEPGQRLYKTGDLARMRRGHRIQVLGRIDDQAKIRGHRVEPSEVEAVIAQHPAICQAAVVLRKDQNGAPSLVAYVTPAPGLEDSSGQVEAALAAQLPPPMLPSVFVWSNNLPLRQNGKVDKKQLQLSALSLQSPQPTSTEAPQNQLEKTIAAIWKEVLRCDHVGRSDNFFDLGGDSIAAIRVAALLRQAGTRITPIQLFQHPTPKGLTEVAVPAQPTVPVARTTSVKAAASHPLTPVQEGLLFHCLSAPGKRLYVSESKWVFGPDFDPQSFVAAWQAIVDRHSIFRTSFHWQDREQPIQVVAPELALRVDRRDWSACSAKEIESNLKEYFDEIHSAGIDLTIAPIMRLALMQLPERRHCFVFVYHHLLMDGWSEGVLIDELEVLYDNFRHGRRRSLPAVAPYHEFVEWLQARDFARSGQFLREYLRGFRTGSAVPGDTYRASSPDQTPTWDAIQMAMGRVASQALRHFAQQSHITMNTLMQGAWSLVLAEYSGESDLVFGAPVAVRPPEAPRLARTIGLFLNMVPVRVRLESQNDVATWLRQLQNEQALVREDSDVPLLQMHSYSEIPHGKPLFETTVGFQNLALAPASYAERRTPLLPIEEVAFRGGWTNYALALDVEPHEEIMLTLSFDERRITASVARQVLKVFEMALSMILEHRNVSGLRQTLSTWRANQITCSAKASLESHRKQFARGARRSY